LIVAISVLLFIQIKYPKKTFSELLGTDEANITKVLMRKGFDMSSVETTDKTKIKELINLLNDRYYRKVFKQELGTGYTYFYDFYLGDKVILRITGSGNYVYISDIRYDVSKEISLDSLNKWFNSIPPKK
jgi:hypothetical protein